MAVMSTLQDNFDAVSLNVSKWTDISFNGAAVTQSGGSLVCTPKVNTANTGAEINSVNSFDLTGSYALIKVPQVVLLGGATFFSLFIDGNNKIFFQCNSNSTLTVQKVVLSAQTQLGSIAYNATAMLWWRIRESGGNTFFEYSADAISWPVLVSVSNPITVTALKVDIEGYDFTSETGQGAATFDNFNIGMAVNDMSIMFR